MRVLRGDQSDLSFASALFYGIGALFSALSITVFRVGPGFRTDVLMVAIACALISGIILYRGYRFSTTAAAALITFAAVVVMWYVWVTRYQLAAINSGLLFYPLFIYLVWFTPMWYARAVGYPWLVAYCLIGGSKFGPSFVPLLVTLVVTSAVLGELLGRFKHGLENTTITDPLCEVWNRRGFEGRLAKVVSRAQRGDRPLSLLYLDLDDFKEVNDRLGHGEGDRVLRDFAQAMQDHIRPQDVFARFGGDEFALLLVDCDRDEALRTGERLQREIDEPAWSFGLAEWRFGEDASEFVSRADLQMLDGKRVRKAARGEAR